ncbi:hypothetical protein Tco_0442875 [Tanacetum coccineum]
MSAKGEKIVGNSLVFIGQTGGAWRRRGAVRRYSIQLISSLKKDYFLGEDATRAIPKHGFNLVNVEGVWLCLVGDRGELTLSSFDVLQGFNFFLQMGFTLILATLNGLDVGLLGDVMGEDDYDDDG